MKENSALDFFFDVSLARCVLSSLYLEHVLFICEEPGSAEEFLNRIRAVYNRGNWTELQCTEYNTVLSALNSVGSGDVLFYSERSYLARKKINNLLSDAMASNTIRIFTGNGADFKIKIAPFTLIMCVERNSPSLEALIPYFGHVIYLESNCAQYLTNEAVKAGFTLDAAAATYLCDAAASDYRCGKRYLQRVIDYSYFKDAANSTIDLLTAQTVVERIRTHIPPVQHDYSQDAIELLHELNDRVKKIENGIHE